MTDGSDTHPTEAGQVQIIGGLVALGVGVVAVALVAGGAMIAGTGQCFVDRERRIACRRHSQPWQMTSLRLAGLCDRAELASPKANIAFDH